MGDGGQGNFPSSKGKEKLPSPSSGPEPPSSGSDGGSRSWARVVQGGLRRPVWSSPKISDREMEELQGYFSAVLDLPVGEVADTRRQWEGRSLFIRSLGRRVSPEAIKREVRRKLQLPADPETFPLAEDHYILRFVDEADCARALKEGPWIVAGQLFAVEPWRPRFNPSRCPVSRALVWLRLPFLPAEFWSATSILSIASKAGRPVEIDSFTDNLTKMGFARVKIEIDVMWPLTPGVLVRDEGEPFWQQFQFECIPSVCFLCGLVGHLDANCPHRGPEVRKEGARPRLGPWVVASKIWQPSPAPLSGTSSSRFGSSLGTSPGSSVPRSNSNARSPPESSPSPQALPGDSEGWRKPSKVARRSSQGMPLKGNDVNTGQQPGPLALIPVRMDYISSSSEVVERAMPDPEALALKRARSPSPEDTELLALLPAQGGDGDHPAQGPGEDAQQSTTTLAKQTTLERPSRPIQVSPRQPCMSTPVVEGEDGDNSLHEGLVMVPVGIADVWQAEEGSSGKNTTSAKPLGPSDDGSGGSEGLRFTSVKPAPKGTAGGRRHGKKSGEMGKLKGGRGLALGPTWCCGSGQDAGVLGGGGEAGVGLSQAGDLTQPDIPSVGSGTSLADAVFREPGRGNRGGYKATVHVRRKVGLREGHPDLGEGASRERSKSPGGLRRGSSGGEGSSGGSTRGGEIVYPSLPHEESLARIHAAVQGEKGGAGEGGVGGGLAQSSGSTDL